MSHFGETMHQQFRFEVLRRMSSLAETVIEAQTCAETGKMEDHTKSDGLGTSNPQINLTTTYNWMTACNGWPVSMSQSDEESLVVIYFSRWKQKGRKKLGMAQQKSCSAYAYQYRLVTLFHL